MENIVSIIIIIIICLKISLLHMSDGSLPYMPDVLTKHERFPLL